MAAIIELLFLAGIIGAPRSKLYNIKIFMKKYLSE
jgi:hypothetical protein